MGHFSHCCKLTGLPITGGTPVALIVMKHRKNLYDNSEESLKQYGSAYMCSNDGTRLKYNPVWLPILGDYDDYGGIENIQEDANTKALEEYYGLDIQSLLDVVTCGRKDDGYSDSLTVVKVPRVYPENWIKGEKHYQYYQRTQGKPIPFQHPQCPGDKFFIFRDGKRIPATKEQHDADLKAIQEHYKEYNEWKTTNPDPEDDYNKPQYQEKYKELLTYSAMWVHGDVYTKLTEQKRKDGEFGNHLDYGRPELLNVLGFTEGKTNNSKKRFNRPFTKGNFTVYSDGTWLDGQIYNIGSFRKAAKDAGEEIDFSPILGKSYIEQLIDIVLPQSDIVTRLKESSGEEIKKTESEWKKAFESAMQKMGKIFGKDFTLDQFKSIYSSLNSIKGFNREDEVLMYKFLNGDYSCSKLSNPMTIRYIENAQDLKDQLNRFWLFDYYMYCCGRYYEVVGTSPQDGEHKAVMTVLNVATEVLSKRIKEWDDENEEEDEDEDE